MRIKATDSTLLIVDIQERLFPVILDAAAMAEHTAWLQQVAKRVGVPVLLTEQYSKGLGQTIAALRDGVTKAVSHTYELSEFLVDVLGVTDVGASFPHRVTYHPTCHSLRMLRVGDRPLRLLRAVEGIDLVELPGAEECCGFGGTFSVKNDATSDAMATDKAANVVASGAEYVVDFLPKIKLETVVAEASLEAVIEAIQQAAGTGKIGDGKIFVWDLERVVRIRTGETGKEAL